MFMSRHYASAVLSTTLLLSGCNPDVTIESPQKSSLHESPPLFEISYQTQPTEITLNNASIESFFSYDGSLASADAGSFASYLREGENRLQVNPPNGPSVKFDYDSTGPVLILESVQGAEPMTVTGRLIDPLGPVSIQVNGESVPLDENDRFIVQVQESAFYEFVAEDNSGKISETTYAAPGTAFDRIVTSRVGLDGISFLADEMGPLIDDVDITPMLPDVNRVLAEKLQEDLALVAAFADVEITGMEWSAVTVDLGMASSADQAVIQFDADLYEVIADLNVIALGGLNIPVQARIGFANATGDAGVAGNSGQLGVQLANMNLQTDDLVINLAGYDTVIISALANLLMPLLEDVVSTFVNGIVNTLLEQTLAEIGDEVQVVINDRAMGMAPSFEAFSSEEDSMHVVLGGSINAKTTDAGIPQVLGSLYSDDALPDATDPSSHILAHVSSNLINQVLMAAYQTGLTHFALIDETELRPGSDRMEDLDPEGSNRVLIDPMSPAFLKVADVDGDPAITFGLNGVKLAMQKKGSSGYNDLFETELDVEARVVLGVNEDDTLRIDFAGEPSVVLRDTLIFDAIAVNEGLIDLIINLAMPKVLPEIAKATQSIELPKLMGFKIVVDDFAAVGDNSSHLGMGITLANAVTLECPADSERYGNKCYAMCDDGYVGVGTICWSPRKETYGRGVGTIPGLSCGDDDLDGALCYPQCDPGYNGVGPVCWQENASYGRGAGTIPNLIPYECRDGKEMDAGLCYWPCNEGYHGVGPVCWADGPLSYGRTAGYIPTQVCDDGEEMDAGLCYTECEFGYNGVGPVCWAQDIEPYDRTVVLEP